MASALRYFKFFVPVFQIAAVMAAADAQVAANPAAAIKEVAVIADEQLDGPGRYGVRKLEEALRAAGVAVSEGEGRLGDADVALVMGLREGRGAAAGVLAEMKAPAL